MSVVKIDLNKLDKSDWKTYRFDEIAKNISERVDPNNTDLTVYIGLEHIDSESLHIKRHGTPDDVNGTKLKFYKGDIIFGRRRAYQRKAGIATWDGFCSAHALVLRANPDVIAPELFPFFLHSDLFMNRAIDISVGSLSPTINWGTLKHQEFSVPSLQVQEKLAQLLVSMNEVINQDNKVFNKLEQYRLVKMVELLNGYHIEENKVKLPSGWKKTKLKDIAKFIDYRGKTPTKTNEGIPLITAKNIRDGWIDREPEEFIAEEDYVPWMTRGIPNKGDVLFTTEAPLGNTAVVNLGEKFALAQRVICLQPNNLISGDFLFFAINNPIVKQKILARSSGTTVSGIRSALLKEVTIPMPPINERQEITKDLKRIVSNMTKAQEKYTHSKSLMKSIIKQVF